MSQASSRASEILYQPANRLFGVEPLPLPYLALLGAITLAYSLASEAAKGWFFCREERRRRRFNPPAGVKTTRPSA